MKIYLTASPGTDVSVDSPHADAVSDRSTIYRVTRFIILLAASLAVFLLSPNQATLFPTNGNVLYIASLAVGFLVVAIWLKYSKKYTQYWLLAYAFFVASVAILSSDLFIGYHPKFVALFGLADENKFMALVKFYDTLLVVLPILLLTIATGGSLGSVYLKVGNQHARWGFGIGALVFFNLFTSVLLFFGTGYTPSKLGPVILWGIVFSFSNSLLEELWIRGLFIRKLIPLLGVVGTVLLTSITFAAMHFLGVAYLPATVIPVYVVNTLTLGITCSVLMIKTDSIWGSYIIHAAADVFLWVAILAVH